MLRTTDATLLRQTTLLSDASEATFAELLTGAFLQAFPGQVELFKEGDNADFLFVVIEGMVELYAGWEGRRSTIATAGPSDTFILAAVVRSASYLMSARTLGRCRLLMLPAVNVRAALASDSAFASSIIGELAMCYRGIVKAQKNLKLRTGVERLAAYMVQACRNAGDLRQFELDIDKQTLASLLGMTPENLSRALAILRAHGVSVKGSTIILERVGELEQLARTTTLIDDPRS